MEALYLRVADLFLEYDRQLISKNVFQIPYKYNAFTIMTEKPDIRFGFHFVEKEKLSIRAKTLPLLYSDAMFPFHYEFRKCEKDILYMMRDKNNQLVFSALICDNWKTVTVLHDYTKTNGIFTFEILGRLLFYAFIQRQILTFHGALMEYDNKGIILSAPSGTGKSTQAHFWRDCYRALIINGDRSLCRKKDGVWTGYGMPWCGSSGEYINRDVPVSAIVVLQQADKNEVSYLSPLEGFQRMYENLVMPPWDKEMINQALDLFDDMLASVPVYLLRCRPEAEAAAVLKKEIDKL